jgi:hypothetical protein
MELKDTGQDSVTIAPEEDVSLPNVYPPHPVKPAMTVDFEFYMGEKVIISHSGLQGAIVAAAVAFNQSSIIYLVDIGRSTEKWCPERMLKRILQPYEQEGIPPAV